LGIQPSSERLITWNKSTHTWKNCSF